VVDRQLTAAIQALLPGARIEATPLPQYPALSLFLLNSDYPQGALTQSQVAKLMDIPLYWVFCWASGQVLAQFLRDEPHWVKGKRVLDFGCGSGVVAIAAALAGAREVIACDIDPQALEATEKNAQLNGIELILASDYLEVEGKIDLIIVADVLYDSENFVWLQRFVDRADQVLIADSRVKNFNCPPYRLVERREASTLPDLDESAEFRDVRIYRAGEHR
jgi:predicted nicotinamide N-methyase